MHKALKLAQEFNKYFNSSNGVDVSARITVSRDEWRELFNEIVYLEYANSLKDEVIQDLRKQLHPLSE